MPLSHDVKEEPRARAGLVDAGAAPTSSSPLAPRVQHKHAPRGFAAMSPERQREIARKGGRAAHRAGTAHEFDVEEARAAGRKGGLAAHRPREGVIVPGSSGDPAPGRVP